MSKKTKKTKAVSKKKKAIKAAATTDKATLYCYVAPVNANFAKVYGRQRHGSFSSYIDHLIQRDRVNHKGVKIPEIARATT